MSKFSWKSHLLANNAEYDMIKHFYPTTMLNKKKLIALLMGFILVEW